MHELHQRYILISWDDSLFQVGQCHCSAVLICAQQEWLFPCQWQWQVSAHVYWWSVFVFHCIQQYWFAHGRNDCFFVVDRCLQLVISVYHRALQWVWLFLCCWQALEISDQCLSLTHCIQHMALEWLFCCCWQVLGSRLKYSCCYWPEGVSTLDEGNNVVFCLCLLLLLLLFWGRGWGFLFVCFSFLSSFFISFFLPSPASMISFDIHGKVFPISA